MVMLPSTDPEVREPRTYGLLEAGYYACVLDTITVVRSRSSSNFYAQVNVNLGPQSVTKLVHFTEGYTRQLQEIMMALGLPYKGVDVTPDSFSIDALGTACIAEIGIAKGEPRQDGIEGNYKDKNSVVRFHPSTADVKTVSLNGRSNKTMMGMSATGTQTASPSPSPSSNNSSSPSMSSSGSRALEM